MDLESQLQSRLSEIKKANRYRTHRQRFSQQAAEVRVKDRVLVNFSSNDYLGLASDCRVNAALKQSVDTLGVGSGSAHLISGHSESHQLLEEELADFLGVERCLLFSTGYMANCGVISALMGRGDRVFQDRLNHASLLDGGLLSGASFNRYQHQDMAALESKLIRAESCVNKLIITDGVFSMDGDLAPMTELVALRAKYGAWLMVDDAHGIGVMGDAGRGTLSHFGISANEVDVVVGTLGKSFGTFGAFVAGSSVLIDYLIQTARSYIYTTAMPAALAEATRVSLSILRTEDWRRSKLNELIGLFREKSRQLGLPVLASQSPIQPVLIGDEQKVMRMAELLFEQGYWVGAIRPPTVENGKARLRIALTANHTKAMVGGLCDALYLTGLQLGVLK